MRIVVFVVFIHEGLICFTKQTSAEIQKRDTINDSINGKKRSRWACFQVGERRYPESFLEAFNKIRGATEAGIKSNL
jgi:hypothetical protein